MFGWGISDFLGGVCSRRKGPFITLFWSQLAGLVLTIAIIPIFSMRLEIPGNTLLLISFLPILYAAALLLFYKGFEKGTISIIAATVNLWAVFAMFFAFVFLGQRLSQFQSLGVMMIIGGVTMVSLKWRDLKKHTLNRSSGIKETVLAAFLFGIYFNLSEVVVEKIGWLATTLYVKVGIIFLLLLFSLAIKRKLSLSETPPITIVLIVLVGVLEAAGSAVVNYGFSVGDVILITPITSALSIITIAMAIIFLKETITKTQGFGIVLAISGIIFTGF